MTPSTKVTAATLAYAVTVIIVWLIESQTDIVIPTAVQGAFTIVLIFAAGYFIPERNPSPSAIAAANNTQRLQSNPTENEETT